jgi:hypothetical protein
VPPVPSAQRCCDVPPVPSAQLMIYNFLTLGNLVDLIYSC